MGEEAMSEWLRWKFIKNIKVYKLDKWYRSQENS